LNHRKEKQFTLKLLHPQRSKTMLKKICAFGLISAAALAISPAAHAQSVQSNVQNANQNAAAIGAYSTVDQTQDFTNFQDATSSPYYGYPSGQLQRSYQDGTQNGAAVGNYSTVDQSQDFYSNQGAYNPSSYLPGAPQTQLSGQTGAQNGAAVGTGSNVYQDQTLDNSQSAYPSYYSPVYPY
jgi:hypothetical protein